MNTAQNALSKVAPINVKSFSVSPLLVGKQSTVSQDGSPLRSPFKKTNWRGD